MTGTKLVAAIIVKPLHAAQAIFFERFAVYAGWYLPLLALVTLAALERAAPRGVGMETNADRALNLVGLAIQGVAIPVASYLLATRLFAAHWPGLAGQLKFGWWGAFALNFVAVDLLYYIQHRAFHRVATLWALHQCHHAAPTVNVWCTSRNSLLINVLFVYLLVNPLLGFMCDQPEGFFFAAAITASLDLWRHSRLPALKLPGWARHLLVTPAHHHLHHCADGEHVNFGANLLLWDRLFGTCRDPRDFPIRYGTLRAPGAWRQFFFPWPTRN
jgi:sterol desaturase/sphingolipid hydroxylase (fatty acid hydroxylase superfamily)